MRNKISILFLIVGIFAIILNVIKTNMDVSSIINIGIIISICILQILNEIIKINKKLILGGLTIVIIVSLFFKITGVELFIPLVVFQLASPKFSLPIVCLFDISVNSIFVKEDFFYYMFFIILINLYLFEIKNQSESELELKEFSRGQRYESHLMEQRLLNLERYIEQNNIVASLKERNYMAQKVHDHLGHRITSSLMQLEVTKETLGKDNELSRKYLISSMENLREGMDEIRKVLKNIKPKEKVMGIEDIKEKLLKFQYSTGIKTTLNITGDVERIRYNAWIIIEENIKEALTNTAKYSAASNVQVSILVFNKFARIEFKDDGKGCPSINKSLGIRGMEQRIQSIGGRIQFDNNNGFIINMIITLGE
ncbi:MULTISPECIES: histidine kinase [Clostridium]|uniref:histidine kinase n=1 Tax=Clostridium cibarium TaxID=2762247 RepID=A0ABR8PTQ1_9CLOT|nr:MULTISPECIES: histidine kinase [Clostridium]MBD7911563.1 two-component sensor histidine kinase [Clostridium cibarium]